MGGTGDRNARSSDIPTLERFLQMHGREAEHAVALGELREADSDMRAAVRALRRDPSSAIRKIDVCRAAIRLVLPADLARLVKRELALVRTGLAVARENDGAHATITAQLDEWRLA